MMARCQLQQMEIQIIIKRHCFHDFYSPDTTRLVRVEEGETPLSNEALLCYASVEDKIGRTALSGGAFTSPLNPLSVYREGTLKTVTEPS